jgi:hypothetical protein
MRAFISVLALCAGIAAQAEAQTPSPSLCIFSSRERSSLAWQTAMASFNGGSLVGRVLRLRNQQPIRSAAVTLEPGGLRTVSDSLGKFQFAGAPNGRYLLRVRALGNGEVKDSVTLGADGLVVLAVLADSPPDFGISCPTPPAPTRRPPAR